MVQNHIQMDEEVSDEAYDANLPEHLEPVADKALLLKAQGVVPGLLVFVLNL